MAAEVIMIGALGLNSKMWVSFADVFIEADRRDAALNLSYSKQITRPDH